MFKENYSRHQATHLTHGVVNARGLHYQQKVKSYQRQMSEGKGRGGIVGTRAGQIKQGLAITN